jgi:TPR repeat protein
VTRRGVWWRPRREDSWWLVAAGIVLAAAAAFAANAKGPAAGLLVLAVLVALGKPLLDRVKVAAKLRDARSRLLDDAARATDERGELPLVRQMSDIQLGVHAAHRELPYLRRDVQDNLTDLLEERRPVLLVGHSMAGKTRLCAQVLRDRYGQWPLLIPEPPDGLAKLAPEAMPTNAVVWLNDLDRYLSPGSFQVKWLDRMLQLGNLVVATMRASEYEKFQPTKDLRPPQTELLERFSVIRLKSPPEERSRLAAQVNDPAVRAGIERYGVAEYIGGGYLGVERYETGLSQHRLGAALVHVAADWRRAGLDTIPEASLAALATHYLSSGGAPDLGEDIPTALVWAGELVDQTMRLLEPAGPKRYRAHDYLVDYLAGQAEPIPDATWGEAAAVASDEEAFDVAWRAQLAGHHNHARQLFTRIAQSDLAVAPDAQTSLGLLLAYSDPPELVEARRWWMVAANAGHAVAQYNLGLLLSTRVDPPELVEARRWYTAAAQGGFAAAQVNLGLLLVTRVDPPELVEARRWWTEAANAGDTLAQCHLGLLLATRVDPPELVEARRWWTEAANAGDTLAQYHLGLLLATRVDPPELVEARRWWTEAANAGLSMAQFDLGLLLKNLDPPEWPEVRRWWTEAANAGHPMAQHNMMVLLTSGTRKMRR